MSYGRTRGDPGPDPIITYVEFPVASDQESAPPTPARRTYLRVDALGFVWHGSRGKTPTPPRCVFRGCRYKFATDADGDLYPESLIHMYECHPLQLVRLVLGRMAYKPAPKRRKRR